jgi:hypothetical protein
MVFHWLSGDRKTAAVDTVKMGALGFSVDSDVSGLGLRVWGQRVEVSCVSRRMNPGAN